MPGLAYVSCPEFLKEGTAVADFMHPDRVVIGADAGDEEAAEAVAALYAPLGEGEILRTDVASAEMIKLASNAFLATKISFINEIANVCEEVGADVGEVARGMGADTRIGSSFLRAGIGYGGSCFPKDVSALKMLAGNTGYHFQLLTSVIEVNELQKRRVVGKLEKHLGSLIGKRVALLGLAFKPDTDDMREASSLVLAARLQGEGAEVVAYDPVAIERASEMLDSVEMADSAMAALEGADAAVLVTEWSEFRDLDWNAAAAAMAHPLIVDGRNFLDPAAIAAAGFEYEGIGRKPRTARLQGFISRPASMQAIVLVGGEGTRLRPLTDTVPKPALTLVDRPFLAYMIEWLAAHGVTEAVLACGFLPDQLREALGEGEHAGVALTYVVEPDRRGTAGAIRFAAESLGDRLEDRFLALNGDVLTDLDLTTLLRAHEERGARATIGLYPVEDSSVYGLVECDADGSVLAFTEKTGEAVPGEINAGAYVLERSVLDLIPAGRQFSIEREVFPRLVGDGLCALRLDGYWMDIGTPERYLQATWDILEGRVDDGRAPDRAGDVRRRRLRAGDDVAGRAAGGRLGRLRGRGGGDGRRARCCSPGCTVGEGARVRGSILGAGATVAPGAEVLDAMVAENERVARPSR